MDAVAHAEAVQDSDSDAIKSLSTFNKFKVDGVVSSPLHVASEF